MRHLAFDLGASSGKLFLGDISQDRLEVRKVYAFPNRIATLNGAMYWDFFRILEEMNHGIRKASSENKLHSFGIDTFNNDFSLLSASGELLLPVRCYRDPRTIAYQAQFMKE